ncbi:MAG: recombinase family protein [Phycisphaerae bacterium]
MLVGFPTWHPREPAIHDVPKGAPADLASLSEQLDNTSDAGRMVFRLLGVFAELERDLVSERTLTARALK